MTGFARTLGGRDLLALAFGAMIGWGWVVLSATWLQGAGPLGAALAFLLGGVIVAIIGLTYAELAAALPQAGGEHVYSERALGRGASFVCTWAIILGYVSVSAFEAVALPTVLTALIPAIEQGPLWTVAGWTVHASWVAIGAGGAALVTMLNLVGVRTAALLQSLVVAVIVLVGVVFMAGGAALGEPARLTPGFIGGAAGLSTVLVMVPFMFVGFDVIPQAAEEVALPRAWIGRMLMLSVALATAFYVGILLAVAVSLDGAALEGAELASADAMGALFGPTGRLALIGAGLAGILTSWNAFVLGASRAIFALARAGLLPAALAELHPRWRTPWRAILLVGGLSALAPLFGRPAMVWLVDAGGLGIVVAYAFVAASFIVLRRREPDLERPFRAPGGEATGWIALLLALGLGLLYLPGSPSALAWPAEWAIVLAWCALGGLLYRFRGR